jgi:hypothetical protein
MQQSWNRSHTLALVSILIAIAGIVVALLNPEIRQRLSLGATPTTERLLPSTDASPVPAATPEPEPTPIVVLMPKDITEFRNINHVELIPETERGASVGRIPKGSYAYILAASLVSKNRIIRNPRGGAHRVPIRVDRYKTTDNFEIHKLGDDNTLLIGYVGLETYERARQGLEPGLPISIYTTPQPIAPSLIALELSSLGCSDARGMVATGDPKVRHHYVVDCVLR